MQEQLIERMKVLRSQFRVWEQCGGEAGIEQWRQRMLGRMFSLSEFMKALKQRFSQWYNRRKGRTGVLWEGRYKSRHRGSPHARGRGLKLLKADS